ncbi:unnamed protein product [Aureobasidium uvarum]|uniref:NAD(P)-binding protein n=1 Tax=Aureobasidium uvarum TaxID=2773716 RepID=A0A9N8KCU1_9PEZI|nr:unnamed protein product [Aureobasidium uvarum]
MAPIKVGLVGLSTASKVTNWAAIAHLPYLQSKQGKALFDVVALCNSSVDSAKKSIQHYGLAESVKSYGSPADLAADPDVELVVCVVGVENHYDVLLPAIKAGKNIYTELPLASNLKQMQELVDLAEKKGVRTMFGSQGQAHPAVHLLKKMIAEDKVGKVLSTTFVGTTGFPLTKVPASFRVVGERAAGGNFATIWFLHSESCVNVRSSLMLTTIGITCLLEVFGELEAFSSMMGNDYPTMDLVDPTQSGKIVDSITKDTPDNIHLQGRFSSGTLITYQMRAGEVFPGEPGCCWIINGEKGDIQITNPRGCFDIEHKGLEIKYKKAGERKAETIELSEDGYTTLNHPAQNVGRLYEAFAKGDTASYADWNVALRRHKLIDEMFARGDDDKPFGEVAQYMK